MSQSRSQSGSPSHSRCSKSVKSVNPTKTEEEIMQEASPRGGGYMMVSPELVEYQSVTFTNVSSRSTCNCGSFDTESENDWEDEDDENTPSLQSLAPPSSFNVIGNLITVVMLLASGNQPNDFQLRIAADYLECIKDDEGGTPPNIQGLLNHIQMITEAEGEGEEDGEEKEEKVVCESKPEEDEESNNEDNKEDDND